MNSLFQLRLLIFDLKKQFLVWQKYISNLCITKGPIIIIELQYILRCYLKFMAFTYFLGDGCFSFFSSSDSASDEDDDVASDSLSDSEDSDSSEELLEDSDSEPLLETVEHKNTQSWYTTLQVENFHRNLNFTTSLIVNSLYSNSAH